ncbi:MAG: protein kinase domain-containing protein [Candidatus Xenobia bacterium]
MLSELIDIPELEPLEVLGQGAQTLVYKAVWRRTGEIVALKLLRSALSANRAAVLQFRREAAYLACLRHESLTRILAVGEAGGQPYLVREYVQGETLWRLLERGPLEERRILELGQAIAGALALVHAHGLVHRDVKPSNILVLQHGVKLIDFGFAARVESVQSSQDIVGTVQYSAPEQTDMLRRPVDGRADLYALGVVLYECGCGQPPFTASDAGELMRLHAVAPLRPPRQLRPDLSVELDAIIRRLLAKDPDDRYQSAESLLVDLGAVGRSHRPLPDATQQVGNKHRIPLIGRQEVVARLFVDMHEAAAGKGRLVMVEGEPGIGKTRLLQELVMRVRPRQVPVVEGVCHPHEARPFGPLRRGVENWLAQLSRIGDYARQEVQARIEQELGDRYRLLARFSAALATAGTATDTSGDLRDPYYGAIADLLLALLQRPRPSRFPCLLVLDNAQWMDDATLHVLERLSAELASRRVLVLVAGRDPLPPRLVALASSRVALPALDEGGVGRLVSAFIGERSPDPGIVGEIARCTGGNPLAVGEYVRALLDTGHLTPGWGGWNLDREAVAALTLPGDVIDLVLRRLHGLPEATRQVLLVAAALGSRFALPALLALEAPEMVLPALETAAMAHLVERDEGDRFRFIHERVREALLDDLDPAARRALHQRIAVGGCDDPFALARHYMQGEGETTPAQAVAACMEAGRQSLEQCAYEEALTFLQHASTLGQSAGLSCGDDYNLLMGDTALRSGRAEQAEWHFRRALEAAPDDLTRADLHARLASVAMLTWDTEQAWLEVMAGFAALDVELPANDAAWTLQAAKMAALPVFAASAAERARLRVLLKLYDLGGHVSYFQNQLPHFAWMAAGSLASARRLGPSRQLVDALCNHAIVLAFARQGSARESIAHARSMAEQLQDPQAVAHTCAYQALTEHLLGEVREAERMAREALGPHAAWLDTLDYLNACTDLTWNLLARGYLQEAWQYTRAGIERARQSPQHEALAGHIIWAAAPPILAILGRGSEGLEHLVRYEAVVNRAHGERPRTGMYLMGRLWFQLEHGESGTAVEETLDAFAELGYRPLLAPYHLRFFYVLAAWARVAQYARTTPGQRSKLEPPLRRAFRELQQACMTPLHRAWLLTLEATRDAVDGKSSRRLAEAEALADQVDAPLVHFELARVRALLAQGDGTVARRHARSALSLALWGGWRHRMRRLRAEYQLEQDVTASQHSVHASVDSASQRPQRHLDALLQLSLASVAVSDPVSLARIGLDELSRILGAERAFLFLLEEDGERFSLMAARDQEGHDLASAGEFSASVIDEVRHARRAVVVTGTDDGLVLPGDSTLAPDLRSVMAAPLMVRERLLGIVYLDNRTVRGVFTSADVDILQALANHIAVALETARGVKLEIAYEGERQQRRLAEILRDLTLALSATLDVGEVLRRLVDTVCEVVPSEAAVAVLRGADVYEARGDEGLLEASRKLHEKWMSKLAARRPDDAPPSLREFAGESEWLLVPVWGRAGHGVQLLGGVFLGRGPGQLFADGEGELAWSLAAQAGTALTNAGLFSEIERLATTDELTGLLNRRQFLKLAQEALKEGPPLSVVYFDVDFFKRCNDSYGHDVGDEVLRVVARRCAHAVREGAHIGRLGGEEFAVVAACDGEDAFVLAERLRVAVGGELIKTVAARLPITLSLGVASGRPDDTDISQLLHRADGALYEAKQNGRNRVHRAH